MDCNVTITGNVGSPVNFKSGETNGRKWQRAEFRVASTRRMRRADGSWGDAGTTWITVQAWGTLVDGIRGSVDKGDPVLVAGRLRTDEWVDTNGEVQSRLMMVADAVGHDLSRGRTAFRRNAPIAVPEPTTEAGAEAEGMASSVSTPDNVVRVLETGEPTDELEELDDEYDYVAVG